MNKFLVSPRLTGQDSWMELTQEELDEFLAAMGDEWSANITWTERNAATNPVAGTMAREVVIKRIQE